MPDLGRILDIWPVWAILVLIIILNLDKIIKNLAVFLPFLMTPYERRAELEATKINVEAWADQADARLVERMLNVIDTSMTRQADAATKTMDAIINLNNSVVQLQHAVDRQATIITGLNQTITVLADSVANLCERINSLKWLLVNKANGDPITIMASLEEDEKLRRK